MPDEQQPVPAVRKTISLTHRQAGITGTVVGLGMLLSNMDALNSLFTTKAEGQATSTAVVELRLANNERFNKLEVLINANATEIKQLLRDSNEETSTRFRRKTDLDNARFEEIEARREKGDDRLEVQIRDLQSYVYKKPPKGG